MITKGHQYHGQWYAAGEPFKDAAHQKWCCDPVRQYGTQKDPISKPKAKKKSRKDEKWPT